MSGELSKLRVHIPAPAFPDDPHLGRWRDASVADLVAALIAEGGEIREANPDYGYRLDFAPKKPGRWLVYGPLPVESAEAKETPDGRDTGEKP